ncbi:hypothetical protein ACWGBV_03660 [Streptomyces sp. NPDC055051]
MLEWVPFRGLFTWINKVTGIGAERLKKRGLEKDRRRKDTYNRKRAQEDRLQVEAEQEIARREEIVTLCNDAIKALYAACEKHEEHVGAQVIVDELFALQDPTKIPEMDRQRRSAYYEAIQPAREALRELSPYLTITLGRTPSDLDLKRGIEKIQKYRDAVQRKRA